jgi:hypothetical protein
MTPGVTPGVSFSGIRSVASRNAAFGEPLT